ncbi:MAG TPA: hypothetical protein VEB20_05215 [Azospirillaceae bacterium]|nr:hypothetical protein [Azospirillaceae bacterium]
MDRCVLEVAGRDAGVLVRDGAGYRFFAAGNEAGKLDGRTFPSIRKAESEVRRLMMAVDWQGPPRPWLRLSS